MAEHKRGSLQVAQLNMNSFDNLVAEDNKMISAGANVYISNLETTCTKS